MNITPILVKVTILTILAVLVLNMLAGFTSGLTGLTGVENPLDTLHDFDTFLNSADTQSSLKWFFN